MKKQIFLAVVVYSFLSLLQPLSNFILLPVYTQFFSESDYGTLAVLNNLNVFLSIIGGLNLVNAIIAFYSSYNDDEELLNKYIGNILSFTFYFNMIFLGVMCLGGNLFFKLIFKQEISFFPNGLLIIVYGMLSNIITGYLNFMKYKRNLARFALISLCLFILNTVLQYVFIVYLKEGISGTLLARVIAVVICFILVLFYNFRYFFAKIEYNRNIKASLMYSTASILSACINWATNYNDRFFIERFIDLKSLGIYSLLSTITSLTEIGYFALGSALQPFIFEYYKENNTRGVQKLYQIFILLSVCMVSFIILFGSNLNLFIQNPGYLQVVNYLSLMAIGYIFSSLYYLFNLQIIYSKKSKYFIYLSLYLLGTSLLLNTALIPKFGIWGAVAGSTIAKLLSAFTIFYFARKSLKLPFEKRNYYMILLFLGVITGFWLLSRNNIISYNLSGILQFISVIAIVFILSRKMLFEFYNLVIQKFRKPVSAD
jgi:O-antigen/teichoic acid export membrane protein